MTEQLEPLDVNTEHMLADVHDLRAALAAAMVVISKVDQRTAEMARVQLEHGAVLGDLAELHAELGPVARRAAAMLASPVGRWASPGTREPRPRRGKRRGDDGSNADRPAAADDRRPAPG